MSVTLILSATLSFALPKCEGKLSKWNNCFGAFTYESGNQYVGEWKNGEPHGVGTKTYPALGTKYVGEWENGRQVKRSNLGASAPSLLAVTFNQLPISQAKHAQSILSKLGFYKSRVDGLFGKGTNAALKAFNSQNLRGADLTNQDNVRKLFEAIISTKLDNVPLPNCIGDFKDGLWTNCIGELKENGRIVYIGEFKNSTLSGKGTFYFDTGSTYVGEFRVNKFNGQGIFKNIDGSSYHGEFQDNRYHGIGTSTFINGNKYIGEFRNGRFDGQGVYFEESTGKYVGQFKEGHRHGTGTQTYKSSEAKYVGGWADGEMSGSGTFYYGTGNPTYKGEFKSNKKNGYGVQSYPDGTVLTGFWKEDNLESESEPSSQPLPESSQSKTFKVASGTGFYVSDKGHIITNYHVIDGCRDMKVHSKGRVLETMRIAADKQNDLALLKIAEAPNHVFPLSNDSPFPLQEVIVAGFPYGDKYSSSLKFTQGIISSLTGIGNNYSEIQIDAALQQGNSGGPIIDEYGNIIAVAVSKLDAKYMFDNFGIIPENTNFGVKASAVRNLMEGNGVSFKVANTEVPSRQELSRQATDGTVFLTCWMTMAQVEKLRSKKVMFEDLE